MKIRRLFITVDAIENEKLSFIGKAIDVFYRKTSGTNTLNIRSGMLFLHGLVSIYSRDNEMSRTRVTTD